MTSAMISMILLAAPLAAIAGELIRAGDLEIDTPWARASTGISRPAVAYVTIRNTGDRPDRLLRVETPASGHTMLHASKQDGGIMRMQMLDSLAIPAGGEVVLQPGATHIMLMDLRQILVEGARLPLTLVFEHAGPAAVDATIGGIAASTPPD